MKAYRRTRPFMRGWGRILSSELAALTAEQQAGYLLINNRGSPRRALDDLESMLYKLPHGLTSYIAGMDVYRPDTKSILMVLIEAAAR